MVVTAPAAVAEHMTRFRTFSPTMVGVSGDVGLLKSNPPTETVSAGVPLEPSERPDTPLMFRNCVCPVIVWTLIDVAGANSGGSTVTLLPIVNAVGGVVL